jgi:hypothetical protein
MAEEKPLLSKALGSDLTSDHSWRKAARDRLLNVLQTVGNAAANARLGSVDPEINRSPITTSLRERNIIVGCVEGPKQRSRNEKFTMK